MTAASGCLFVCPSEALSSATDCNTARRVVSPVLSSCMVCRLFADRWLTLQEGVTILAVVTEGGGTPDPLPAGGDWPRAEGWPGPRYFTAPYCVMLLEY